MIENFTARNDKFADAAMKKVIGEVLDVFFSFVNEKYVKAIFLIGGAGRGEAGIYHANNQYWFVNDLDFLIIPKKRKKRILNFLRAINNRINELKLSQKTGLKQIDFIVSSKLSLRFSPKLISFYELREGNKLIWGKCDLKFYIPFIKPNMLPLFDGTRLFYNRGYGLVIACYTIANDLDRHEIFRKNIVIELQKAIIAIGDTLLLKFNKYHFSYAQRLKNFNELLDKQSEMELIIDKEMIRKLYARAINNKLLPSESTFSIDYKKEIAQIIPLFLQFYLEFESDRLKRRFKNWEEYSAYIISYGLKEPLSLRIRQNIKKIRSKKDATLNMVELLAILPHLLLSWNNNFFFNQDILFKFLKKKKIVFEEHTDLIKMILINYHKDGIISDLVSFVNEKR